MNGATFRLLLAGLWLVCAGLARADAAPRVRLDWRKPVGSHCPSAADVQAEVERAAGRRVFTQDDAAVLVQGTLQDAPTGVRVALEMRSPQGQTLGARVLEAEPGQCAAMRGYLALVLTVMLDQLDSQATLNSRSSRRGARLAWGGELALLSGLLPRVSGAIGPLLALEAGPRLRLDVELSYLWPVSAETARGVGARFQGLAGALRLCPRVTREGLPWALALCGGLQASMLVAAPRGLDGAGRHTRVLPQLRIEARLGYRFRSLLVEGALGLVSSLHRPRFSYERADGERANVFRPAPVSALFSLSLIKL